MKEIQMKEVQKKRQNPSIARIWPARIAVALVFIINIQSALQFIFTPERFMASYALDIAGVSGMVALQGLGVAFLMWNATYPLVIVHPWRFRIIYAIVLIQQALGLIGETGILLSRHRLPEILTSSILRFIVFDGTGLVLMLAAYIWMYAQHKDSRRCGNGSLS